VPVFAALAWASGRELAIHGALLGTGAWHAIVGMLVLLASPLSIGPATFLVIAFFNCLLASRIAKHDG